MARAKILPTCVVFCQLLMGVTCVRMCTCVLCLICVRHASIITPDGEALGPVGSRDSPPSPSMLQGSHALAIMTSSVV